MEYPSKLIRARALLRRLISLSPPTDNDILWILARAIRRINELHLEQLFLYRVWKDEENEKEKYKHLYESEKERHVELEKMVDSYNKRTREITTCRFNACKYTLQNIIKIHRSTQSIIETDQKIIEHLVKERARNLANNSELVLCVVHYLIAYAKENARLRAETRKFREKEEQHAREIQELEDRILRDPTIQLKDTEFPINITG